MKPVVRYIVYFIVTFCCVSFSFTQEAMTNFSEDKSILDELNSSRTGEGKVIIYQDEAIKGVVGKEYEVQRSVYVSSSGERYVKMRGFKIHVFSGNDQRRAKNEAYYKQRLINSAFPEQETVVLFNAPFWRLRAGNFKTREAAEEVLEEMRSAFSAFGREMYIVVDEVKIPI